MSYRKGKRHTLLSVIVPARNEESFLGETIDAILHACRFALDFRPAGCPAADGLFEVIVVDNYSIDGTSTVGLRYVSHGVRLVRADRVSAAYARNCGARAARGRILCFVDADTLIPSNSLQRVITHVIQHSCLAGFSALEAREPLLRARFWWSFWTWVRSLPLARAKAMSAFMFCTREAFERFGPFDENVVIGEEWPVLAGTYAAEPQRFIYDREIVARTSSRRMELQRLGYLRTFIRYVLAVLIPSGRKFYPDCHRHTGPGALP
jgi:glycosyltransferase involved in cell wall biosynthesis